MSDTDLTALRKKFEQHLRHEVRGSVQDHDAGDVGEAAWNFIKDQFQIAVPLETYENATANLVRLQNKVQALPSQVELATLLETLLWERGSDVRIWPEDEAEAYRRGRDSHSINRGVTDAHRLVLSKAATAIRQRIDVSL